MALMSINRVSISAVLFAMLISAMIMIARADTIPGIPDSELAQMKGCSLGAPIAAQVRSVFGPYDLTLHGNAQEARSFFPSGAAATENAGEVWCAFVHRAGDQSQYLLIRHQVYASTNAAEEGFNLALSVQDQATPDNTYTVTKRGKLTLAVRKYGEVMALRGEQISAATWYVPAQQPDPVDRNVSGSKLIPVAGALLCDGKPSC